MDEAREYLTSLLQPGDTIYAVTRQKSGINHVVAFFVMKCSHERGLKVIPISHPISLLLGHEYRSRLDGICVMAFGDPAESVAEELGAKLFPNEEHPNFSIVGRML